MKVEAPSTNALIDEMSFRIVARCGSQALPLTHFLRIIRGVLLKGNGWVEIWPEIWPIAAFMLAVSALALLRYLTNPKILGPAALDSAAAWDALQIWLALPHVSFLPEPAGLNELLAQWAGKLDLRAGKWTDAYLAAFAAASDCRLVAFDSDFHRYPGVEFLHLRP